MQSFRTLARPLAAVVLAASALATPADTPKQGGTLIWAIQNTPRHLNPAVQSGISTGQPGTQLFAAPLRYDDQWNPHPYLAREWHTSDDGLTVTLKLVEGATFHDGMPITSKDVAFSIRTVQENHPFKTMYAPVERVETPDDHTAVIRLSKPHPALLLAMSSQLLPIIPEHVYGDGQDPKSHPRNSRDVVGSGPFKLVEFKRDEHIILERYEDFFIEGRPYVDKIVMRILKDGSARTIALENGEVHLSAFEQNARDLNRLKEKEHLLVTPDGYAAIGPIAWLAFNTQREPTSDQRVRQAIAHAIDREFLPERHLPRDLAGSAYRHPSGEPVLRGGRRAYDLDLDKANEILDEAGYPRGAEGNALRAHPRIRMGRHQGPGRVREAGAEEGRHRRDGTQGAGLPDMGETGLQPRVRHVLGRGLQLGRPGDRRASHLPELQHQEGGHLVQHPGLCEPEVDAILDEAGQEMDSEKRKALYSGSRRSWPRSCPLYWTNTLPYHTVANRKVGNPAELDLGHLRSARRGVPELTGRGGRNIRLHAGVRAVPGTGDGTSLVAQSGARDSASAPEAGGRAAEAARSRHSGFAPRTKWQAGRAIVAGQNRAPGFRLSAGGRRAGRRSGAKQALGIRPSRQTQADGPS